MTNPEVVCKFYFEDIEQNRKMLFNKSIASTKNGRVLYILPEELNELPQLSQDLNQIDRHYMKMITFIYAPCVKSLLESIVTLPNWQHIPSTIVLDNLSEYCTKDNIQNACGITVFLIDTARSCSKILKSNCNLYISAPQVIFGEDTCDFIKEMYMHTFKY